MSDNTDWDSSPTPNSITCLLAIPCTRSTTSPQYCMRQSHREPIHHFTSLRCTSSSSYITSTSMRWNPDKGFMKTLNPHFLNVLSIFLAKYSHGMITFRNLSEKKSNTRCHTRCIQRPYIRLKSHTYFEIIIQLYIIFLLLSPVVGQSNRYRIS